MTNIIIICTLILLIQSQTPSNELQLTLMQFQKQTLTLKSLLEHLQIIFLKHQSKTMSYQPRPNLIKGQLKPLMYTPQQCLTGIIALQAMTLKVDDKVQLDRQLQSIVIICSQKLKHSQEIAKCYTSYQQLLVNLGQVDFHNSIKLLKATHSYIQQEVKQLLNICQYTQNDEVFSLLGQSCLVVLNDLNGMVLQKMNNPQKYRNIDLIAFSTELDDKC